MKKTLKIDQMTCAHCAAAVENALKAFKGVTAKVNLESGEAAVQFKKPLFGKNEPPTNEQIKKAVSDAGYILLSSTDWQ